MHKSKCTLPIILTVKSKMTCQGDNRRTETFTTVLLTNKYRRKGQKMNSDFYLRFEFSNFV